MGPDEHCVGRIKERDRLSSLIQARSTTRMTAYRSSLIATVLILLLSTSVTLADAPPFSDYCQRLPQEIQRKKHGFLT